MTNDRKNISIFKISLVFSGISVAVYFLSDLLRWKFDLQMIFFDWTRFFLIYGTEFICWVLTSLIVLTATSTVSTDLTAKPLLIRISLYTIISMFFQVTFLFIISKAIFQSSDQDLLKDFLSSFTTSFSHGCMLTIVWIAMTNKK